MSRALGSMNMDTFLHVESFVRPGETISATAVRKQPGGKGLNQSLGAARMGAPVVMVGALGIGSDGDAIHGAAHRERVLALAQDSCVNDYISSTAMIQIASAGARGGYPRRRTDVDAHLTTYPKETAWNA